MDDARPHPDFRSAIAVEPGAPESLVAELVQLLRSRRVAAVVDRFDGARDAARLARWVAQQESSGVRVFVAVASPPGMLATLLCACTHRPVVFLPVTAGRNDEAIPACAAPVATVTPDAPGNAAVLVERIFHMADARPAVEEVNAATQKKAPPAEAHRAAPRPAVDPADCSWVDELARDFRPRLPSRTARAAMPPRRRPLDYSPALRAVLTEARQIAAAYGCGSVHAVHLLAGILDSPGSAARTAIERAGGNLDKIAVAAAKRFPPAGASEVRGALAPDAEAILAAAKDRARAAGQTCMTTLDFLAAMIAVRGSTTAKALRAGLPALKRLESAMGDPTLPDETEPLRQPQRPIGRPVAEKPERVASVLPDEQVATEQLRGTGPQPSVERPDVAAQVRKPPVTLKCDPDDPPLEVVEAACDALLEGGLVALPCDTMLGLAADATNPVAVAALREALGLAPEQPVGVLIHSTAALRHLTGHLPPPVESLLDDLWPGPLTVVFPRRAGALNAVTSGQTVGIRIPADYLSLAILSMLGRPLAVVRMRSAGQAGCSASLILDIGRAPAEITTTVLSVTEVPHRILRQGAVERWRIEAALGTRLAD